MHKTRRMLAVEQVIAEPVEQYITRALSQGKKQNAIAQELGITKSTMTYWLMVLEMKGYGTQKRETDGNQL